MVQDGLPRRRRRRRRRGGEAAGVADAPGVRWGWLTFPVLFSFVLGALVMAVLIGTEPGAYYVFLVGSVFAVAFGAAHLFARRRARRRKQ